MSASTAAITRVLRVGFGSHSWSLPVEQFVLALPTAPPASAAAPAAAVVVASVRCADQASRTSRGNGAASLAYLPASLPHRGHRRWAAVARAARWPSPAHGLFGPSAHAYAAVDACAAPAAIRPALHPPAHCMDEAPLTAVVRAPRLVLTLVTLAPVPHRAPWMRMRD